MTSYVKQLVIFDLDGTLALSKDPLDPAMASLLVKLLEIKKVAVVSGCGFHQFENQFLHSFPSERVKFSNLIIMPVSGARLYVWRGTWNEEYTEHLETDQKKRIVEALNFAIKSSGLQQPEHVYGEIIEDRGPQITFSALGQNAPLELKMKWDPDHKKRDKIIEILDKKIPEFSSRSGGTTSIDITLRGINKGYAIRKLEKYLNIPLDNMVFVGDALYHGGNDFPAKATGIDCIQVKDPEETKKLIASWLV